MTNHQGMSLTEVQLSMTGPELKLLKMIKYKNTGSNTPTCTADDYREACKNANVNAYDHDNYRKNKTEVISSF